MSKLGGERSAVQNTLIQYACEIGWEYVKPEDAVRLRGGTTGLLFKDIFTERLVHLNAEFMDSIMVAELSKQLERLPAKIEGNLQAWEYLTGLKTVFLPTERRERNVIMIGQQATQNCYQVTDEYSYTNGLHTNRYDVVFLVNGIPVFFVETKAVANFFGKRVHRESIIVKALEQIQRYHRETPEAMTLLQLYTATNLLHFLYAATWSLSLKTVFNWKTELADASPLEGGQGDVQTYETLVKTFFHPQHLTDILLKFILFTTQDDQLQKVILRPHQMRAVDKIVARASDKQKQRALIWHTQGSGKTYTMILAAQRILHTPHFENPTVLMLVDRNELETQLFGNLSAAGIIQVEVAQSKKHLQELLQNDTRGLIVSMIHKFENMPADVNTRKNIFVLVDEAHRTTDGDLGTYLMGALPNATYLGFTGTPIDKTAHGKGTFVVFGKDDPPQGYLDKYGIAESIEDGTTVKLHYTLAPNELKPDREVLEKEFLELAEAQGLSDPETLNKVLDRAVTLRNMLKSPDRVQQVTQFVTDHFRNTVEPMGYKAFLVAVDREACALYKTALDQMLPAGYAEVVFSPDPAKDSEEMKGCYLSRDEEKQLRKDFRDPAKLPKILIVTEKLLTGFDAPVLYCLYLDKPMRDHVLLQAIARVNRPYEDKDGHKKPCGFVLDFVGIFDKLEQALAFDSADITGVIEDLEVLKIRFAELMAQARTSFLTLTATYLRDKAVERILEYFRDEEQRQHFYDFFTELEDLYDILSPDVFLRPYLSEYEELTRMFLILLEAYGAPGLGLERELTRKTAQLVRERTQSSQIQETLAVYEINEHTLRKLEATHVSDTEKVHELNQKYSNGD